MQLSAVATRHNNPWSVLFETLVVLQRLLVAAQPKRQEKEICSGI